MTDGLRIGDVARSAGVNVQTLRYYERRGLVLPEFRRHSGQRGTTIRPSVACARSRRRSSWASLLTEIQELFDLSAHRRGTDELHARAMAKIAEIDERIEQLQGMRVGLEDVIEAQCDSLTDCSCGLGCPIPFEPPA